MFRFGSKTYPKIIQNQAPAVVYNFRARLFTACVLFSNFVLTSAMVAVLMSLNNVIVAKNAKLFLN